MNRKLEERKHQYALLVQHLEALSPLKKLAMGYAFVEQASGEVVNSVSNLHKGDGVNIYLKDGNISATITEVQRIER